LQTTTLPYCYVFSVRLIIKIYGINQTFYFDKMSLLSHDKDFLIESWFLDLFSIFLKIDLGFLFCFRLFYKASAKNHVFTVDFSGWFINFNIYILNYLIINIWELCEEEQFYQFFFNLTLLITSSGNNLAHLETILLLKICCAIISCFCFILKILWKHNSFSRISAWF